MPPKQQKVDDANRIHTDPVYWHSTLIPSSAITATCSGSFSGMNTSEVVIARHTHLELYALSKKNQLERIDAMPAFATIRSIAPVPIASINNETSIDLLAVTSDSGDIVLLRFVKRGNENAPAVATGGTWVIESQVPFTKYGIRCDGPGHYLSTDSEGRCLFVTAPLKQRLLFPIKQEGTTLSFDSPIETHRNSIVFDVISVEIEAGENPTFAVLEHPLGDASDATSGGQPPLQDVPPYNSGPHNAKSSMKQLTYYQYDVGTNNVLKTWGMQVPNSAHKLVAVPLQRGPGGVLVCAEREIWWVHQNAARGHIATIPRRDDCAIPAGELRIIAATTVVTKKAYFVILQTQFGDLYRVEISKVTDPNTGAEDVILAVRYFESLDCIAKNMILNRTGCLFVAAESGPHRIYKVCSEGYKDDTYISTVINVNDGTAMEPMIRQIPCFSAHTALKHLAAVDSIPNSGAMTTAVPQLTKQGVIELHTLCGTGGQSAVMTSRSGHNASLQDHCSLASACQRVWFMPDTAAVTAVDGSVSVVDKRCLVVSTTDKTSVLQFNTAAPVPGAPRPPALAADSATRFNLSVPTVLACALENNCGTLQVHRDGLRHVCSERVVDWRHDLRKEVASASCNGRQLIVGFANGGGFAVFHLDTNTKQLGRPAAHELSLADTTSVTVPTAPNNATSTAVPFVGVSLVSREFYVLDANTLKKVGNKQPLTYDKRITSSHMCYMSDGQLYAFVGMADGVVIRVTVDNATGVLKAKETLICGTAPCRIIPGNDALNRSCYVISSQMWRCTTTTLEGLVGVPLVLGSVTGSGASAAATISGSDVAPYVSPEGSLQLAHLVDTSIYILDVDTASRFHHHRTPLRCTGRQMVRINHGPYCDYMCISMSEKRSIGGAVTRLNNSSQASGTSGSSTTARNTNAGENGILTKVTTSPQDQDKQSSYLQLYSPATRSVGKLLQLPYGDAVTSLASVRFDPMKIGGDPFIVVGVAGNFNSYAAPQKNGHSSLQVFRIHKAPEAAPGTPAATFPVEMSLAHVTWLKDIPSALCEFKNHVLVGMGAEQGLVMYAWGKKRLLRQHTLPNFPSRITAIQTQDDLICCGTAEDSVVIVRHHKFEEGSGRAAAVASTHTIRHCFMFVARDPTTRFLSAMRFVDNSTIAIADKLGSISILRIPADVVTDCEDAIINDDMLEYRAEQPLTCVATTYVGQVVTSLTMTAGNPVVECDSDPSSPTVQMRLLTYSTIFGKVGCIQPFVSDEDTIAATYMSNFLLGKGFKGLTGRPVISYLSSYFPMRNFVEADALNLLDRADTVVAPTDAAASENTTNSVDTRKAAAARGEDVLLPSAKKKELMTMVDHTLNNELRKRASRVLQEEIRPFPTPSQLIQKMKLMVPL